VHKHETDIAVTAATLKQELFADVFGEEFAVPEDSAVTSVLDTALDTYARVYGISNTLVWVVLILLLLSFCAEVFYSRAAPDEQKKLGLIISRMLLFFTLPIIFAAVMIMPSPNYFSDIEVGVQNIPRCAPVLDATIESLVSQALGMAMGSYLTSQLFFVLLLGVPALMHGAYFITWREVRRLKQLNVVEPRDDYYVASKRSNNSRLVFRVFPWLNPVLTFIPSVLMVQFLNGRLYIPLMVLVFWALPMTLAQWGRWNKSEDIFFWFYFFFWLMFMVLYFTPLAIVLAIEGARLGQVDTIIKSTFYNPYWYLNSLAESCLMVIIVCDVLYLFLANNDKDVGDLLIDDYLKAVRMEAQLEAANMPLLEGSMDGSYDSAVASPASNQPPKFQGNGGGYNYGVPFSV